MSLSKIAKLANVSVSTASKVFSGSNEISIETKQRVVQAAKALGCFEKYNRITYGRKLIAVICPEVMGIHYSDMVTIIDEKIKNSGGVCLFSVTNFSTDTQNMLVDYYANFAKVDGIIVIDPDGEINANTSVPIVQIGSHNKYSNVYDVDINVYPALDEALQTLKQKGHKEIGFIGERFTPMKYEAFCKCMKRRELAVKSENIAISDKRFYDCGYWGMDELLKRDKFPTAVFLAYSHVAVGALRRLREAKLKVPQDISFVCMDDIPITPYTAPGLACIRMHIPELCSEAIRLLNYAFENPKSPAQSVMITRQFCEGNTILDISKKDTTQK